MSPRTLWNIILKILGLYIFLQGLVFIPQLISSASFFSSDQSYRSSFLLATSTSFFSISIYLFLIIVLIFRTDWLINALRLEKGIHEEKLEFNMHRSTIFQIAVIIAGLILLVESLPLLLRGLFAYYQSMNDYNGFKKYPYAASIITELVKVFIGFFMVTSSRLIVNYVERSRKRKTKVAE